MNSSRVISRITIILSIWRQPQGQLLNRITRPLRNLFLFYKMECNATININVRENRRGIQERTIQRNRQHQAYKIHDKHKQNQKKKAHNTICLWYHYWLSFSNLFFFRLTHFRLLSNQEWMTSIIMRAITYPASAYSRHIMKWIFCSSIKLIERTIIYSIIYFHLSHCSGNRGLFDKELTAKLTGLKTSSSDAWYSSHPSSS